MQFKHRVVVCRRQWDDSVCLATVLEAGDSSQCQQLVHFVRRFPPLTMLPNKQYIIARAVIEEPADPSGRNSSHNSASTSASGTSASPGSTGAGDDGTTLYAVVRSVAHPAAGSILSHLAAAEQKQRGGKALQVRGAGRHKPAGTRAAGTCLYCEISDISSVYSRRRRRVWRTTCAVATACSAPWESSNLLEHRLVPYFGGPLSATTGVARKAGLHDVELRRRAMPMGQRQAGGRGGDAALRRPGCAAQRGQDGAQSRWGAAATLVNFYAAWSKQVGRALVLRFTLDLRVARGAV